MVETTTVIVIGISGIGNAVGKGGITPCGSDGLGPVAAVGNGGIVLVGYGVAIGAGVCVGTGVAAIRKTDMAANQISLRKVLIPIVALAIPKQ